MTLTIGLAIYLLLEIIHAILFVALVIFIIMHVCGLIDPNTDD